MEVESGVKTPLKPRMPELKEVDKSPKGIFDYVNGLFGFLGRTIAFFIIVAVLSVIPIVMLAIGAAFRDRCPLNPNIPIYLIVCGTFGILKSVIQVINNVRIRKRVASGYDAVLKSTDPLKLLDSLVSTFLFIWMICGSVWVFKEWKPNFNEKDIFYCNQTVYMTAFVILLLGWIFVIVAISLCCCLCAFVCFCGTVFAAAATSDRN